MRDHGASLCEKIAYVLAYSVRLDLFSQAMNKLDPIDRRILQALSADGRISNVDLATKIGLSASACLRRVQELERSGIITGYRAVLDPVALGIGFAAYVAVGLSRHTKDQQYGFEAAIANAPEVRECHNVTGTFEYLLRVETTDLAAYKHFHTEVLGALPQVSTITSYVVMGSPKDERG
jgi:Lrp/AsnC family transcriptional regulator, leucine-responsive regulatory protein